MKQDGGSLALGGGVVMQMIGVVVVTVGGENVDGELYDMVTGNEIGDSGL